LGLAVLAGIGVLTIVLDDATELLESKRSPHVNVEYAPDAEFVVGVFPPVLSRAKWWFADIRPAFGKAVMAYADYSESGYDPKVLFPEFLRQVTPFAGKPLVLFGASFGSSVVIELRRYIEHNAPGMFPAISEMFYSGFGPGSDLRPATRIMAGLAGNILRGGPAARALWRKTSLPSMFYPKSSDLPQVDADRLAAIKAGIDQFPYRLFASQLPEITFGVELIPNQFPDDRVLILVFGRDDVVLPRAALHLQAAFTRGEIVQVAAKGHADISTLPTLAAVRSTIERFLVAPA
jgi:hypothetical protein